LAAGQGLAGLSRPLGPSHQTSPIQILERSSRFDLGKASDRPSSAGYHELGSLPDLLQVLAEAIVKLTHSNLGVSTM
jgi:hypothetical protein